MTRTFAALAVLLVLALHAHAQDMPLSQILIEGEGWKKVGDTKGVPEGIPFPPRPAIGPAEFRPAMALSADRATLYFCRGRDGVTAISAMQKGIGTDSGAPYCPLRLPRGKKAIIVSGLAVDVDGRIYAATELGVQIFDPTGRLCGVLGPAAPGIPGEMWFEGDRLTMWIGGTKYGRKLNTTGVK